MNVAAKIQANELKIVALRKAAIELDLELAEIKLQTGLKPVPANQKKQSRMEKFASYYLKKGIL